MSRNTHHATSTIVDFGALEALWIERARRVAALQRRADPTGMTRPPRDPEERAWLAQRGGLGPFVEAKPPIDKAMS